MPVTALKLFLAARVLFICSPPPVIAGGFVGGYIRATSFAVFPRHACIGSSYV